MLGFGAISEFSISEIQLVIIRPVQTGGGYNFYDYTQYIRKKEHLKEEIEEVDKELARKQNIEQEQQLLVKAAKSEALLEAKYRKEMFLLQEEINRLRMRRVWLMRLLDDEEAIIVILAGISTIH